MGRTRPRPSRQPQQHALLRQRRHQAGTWRRGVPLLARPPGHRSNHGSRPRRVLAARRAGSALPLLPIAHDRPYQRRLREGSPSRPGRLARGHRQDHERAQPRGPGLRQSPAVPRIDGGRARRRRGLRPPPRRRGAAPFHPRDRSRPQGRAAEGGRGLLEGSRPPGRDLSGGAAVVLVRAPRAQSRNRRPRVRPRTLRPVPLPRLPPQLDSGEITLRPGAGAARPDLGQVRRDHRREGLGRIADEQLLPGVPEPEHRRPHPRRPRRHQRALVHVPDRARTHPAAAARSVGADQLQDAARIPASLRRTAPLRNGHAGDVQRRRARAGNGEPRQDARGRARQQPERLRRLFRRRPRPDGVQRLLQPGQVLRAGAQQWSGSADGRATGPDNRRPGGIRDLRPGHGSLPRTGRLVRRPEGPLRQHRPGHLRHLLPRTLDVGPHRRLHRARHRLARRRIAVQDCDDVRSRRRHRRRCAVGRPHPCLRAATLHDGAAGRGARRRLAGARDDAPGASEPDAALRKRRRPRGPAGARGPEAVLQRGGVPPGRAGSLGTGSICSRRRRTSRSAS